MPTRGEIARGPAASDREPRRAAGRSDRGTAAAVNDRAARDERASDIGDWLGDLGQSGDEIGMAAQLADRRLRRPGVDASGVAAREPRDEFRVEGRDLRAHDRASYFIPKAQSLRTGAVNSTRGRPTISDAERRNASDAELGGAVSTGDEAALAELYGRHGGPCLALARRILADRVLAEEIVQEVFLRLWRAPDRFDPERGSMRSFLFAQVHGRAVDLVRAETARRAREQRDAFRSPTIDDDLERAVADLAEAETIRRAVGSLSEGERSAIELAYFGGHTYREVAVLLDQPEGTVKSRIRSGLLRLRAALIEAGVGE